MDIVKSIITCFWNTPSNGECSLVKASPLPLPAWWQISYYHAVMDNSLITTLSGTTWRWSDHFDVIIELGTQNARMATYGHHWTRSICVLWQVINRLLNVCPIGHGIYYLSRNILPLIFSLNASHFVKISKAICFSRDNKSHVQWQIIQ